MHIFHQKPQKFCMKMDLKLGESCFDSSQCAKKNRREKGGKCIVRIVHLNALIAADFLFFIVIRNLILLKFLVINLADKFFRFKIFLLGKIKLFCDSTMFKDPYFIAYA